MNSSSFPQDEPFIKNVFGVTLDSKETQYTLLVGLSTQLNSIMSAIANVSQLAPPPAVDTSDMIPCEHCSTLFPLDQIMEHQDLCLVYGPQNLPPPRIQRRPPPPSSSPSPFLIPSNLPPPKLDRNTLQVALKERLLMFANNPQGGSGGIEGALKYLISCYQKASQLGTTAIEKELSGIFKERIMTCTKEIILAEQIKKEELLRRANKLPKMELLAMLDSIPIEFLRNLYSLCKDSELKLIVLPMLLELSFEMRNQVIGKNILSSQIAPLMRTFFSSTSEVPVMKVLSSMLSDEVRASSQRTAREIENTGILGGFLTPSAIISPYDKGYFNYFVLTIPNYPNCPRQEVHHLQENLRSVIRQSHECLHSVLKRMLLLKEDPIAKENILSWLSISLQLNDARVDMNPNDPLSAEMTLILSTHGYCMNLLNVLLLFCKPFLDPKGGKMTAIDPSYLTHGRVSLKKYPKLGKFENSEELKSPSGSSYNFMTEIFFLTYYGIHVCFIPCLKQYQNLVNIYSRNKKEIESMKRKFGDSWSQNPNGEKMMMNDRRLSELLDSSETAILDPEFLVHMGLFCQFSIAWMSQFIGGTSSNPSQTPSSPSATPKEPQKELKALFSSLPEFLVRDIAELIILLIRNKFDVIQSSLPNLPNMAIDWVVDLLSLPYLVKNPLIRWRLSSILVELLICKNTEDANFSRRGMSNQFSIVGSALSDNRKAHQSLAFGLMQLYSDVDVIEGLDVDKEDFDKYNVRRDIALLFDFYWNIPQFKQSLKKQVDGSLYIKFVSTVLNDSIHLLDDSLGRLIDIRQLQLAMANFQEWEKQDPLFRQEREKYYEIQENSARGFMSLANTILDILLKIAKENAFIDPFLKSDISRVAAMLNHFFDALCGPKCINLKVQNPEKYNFNPKQLLMKITNIMMCFASHQVFIETVAKDIDYSPEIMNKALHFLKRERIVPDDTCNTFAKMISSIDAKIAVAANEGAAKNSAQMGSSDPMKIDIPEEEIESIYKEQMTPFLFDTFLMKQEDSDKYLHHYATNIASNISNPPSKMQRLMQECQMLGNSLPLSSHSSVFVRADEERLDVMKAVITGPKDSPYSLGCFQFDIYFPATYPMDPPLCNLETTGNGTVRFNPNLYNCGKVCLSLLGTWHGDSIAKWNPTSSTLHQVLVSIQALILVEKPYFNEPAYEAQRNTKEGEQRSNEYNEAIRLATVRHAMIGQLRNPSPGFEEVIRTHFRLLKGRVIKQCEQWLAESSEVNKAKFQRSLEDLNVELSKL